MAEDNIFAQSNNKKAAPAAAPTPTAAPVAQPAGGKKTNVGLIVGISAGGLALILAIVIFAVVNGSLNSEAVKRYSEIYNEARTRYYAIDSDMYETFRDAGYSSYYSDEERTEELQNECLEELGMSSEEIQALRNLVDGDKIYENEGRKGLNQASELLENAVSNYDAAKKNFKKCGELVTKSISKDVEIKLGDLVIEEGKYSTKTSLDVTVTNTSKEAHSYTIKVQAVGSNGEMLKTETVYASDLRAGQTTTRQIFTYLGSDVDKYKDAKFEIISVEEYK